MIKELLQIGMLAVGLATSTPAQIDPNNIPALVAFHAERYQLAPAKVVEVLQTIKHESDFKPIQSQIIDKNGKQEDSWGIAQIHLPDHPKISKAQALDNNFAVEFIVREFKAGREWQWSAWKKLYGHNNKSSKTSMGNESPLQASR